MKRYHYEFRVPGCGIAAWGTKKLAEQALRGWKKLGYDCGPIVRVPIPQAKTKKTKQRKAKV